VTGETIVADILSLASQLGQAIAEAPQAKALRAARQAMHAQKETLQLLSDYQKQIEKVAALEQDGKPVEPDDKRTLKALESRLLSRPDFKAFTAAQVEYVELMRQVNDTLRQKLDDLQEPPG
jgi:cell fate (sporulation/competence/biofilm development) regulator YlbF (YheA/YmcA/DUF963 family)